jgi:hypothetical protein
MDMDELTFDDITRTLVNEQPRRTVLWRVLVSGIGSLAAASLGGTALPDAAAAKRLCRKNGSRCKQKGKGCKAKFCRPEAAGLRTPFTIEARWGGDASFDHDSYFLVPNAEGNTDPFPFVGYWCRTGQTACDSDVYPYVCVDDDIGEEVVTVRRLLPGVYEYWLEVEPGGSEDVTVLLRNADGRVLRSWAMPPNPFSTPEENGWHVFDLDGSTGHITTVDQFFAKRPPGLFTDLTDVCAD